MRRALGGPRTKSATSGLARGWPLEAPAKAWRAGVWLASVWLLSCEPVCLWSGLASSRAARPAHHPHPRIPSCWVVGGLSSRPPGPTIGRCWAVSRAKWYVCGLSRRDEHHLDTRAAELDAVLQCALCCGQAGQSCSQLETQTRAAEFSQAVATLRTSTTGNSRVSAQGSIMGVPSSTTPSHHDRMKPRHASAAICQGQPLTLSSTREPDWRMAARPSLRCEQPSADRGALRDDRRWGCLGLALPETPRRRSVLASGSRARYSPRHAPIWPRTASTVPYLALDGPSLGRRRLSTFPFCSCLPGCMQLRHIRPPPFAPPEGAGGCPWAARRSERRANGRVWCRTAARCHQTASI